MRLGIQKKLALSFSAFMILVLTLIFWSIYAYSKHSTREIIKKQQYALTELIAHSIDDKLGSILASISQIAVSIPPDAFKNPAAAQIFLNTHQNFNSVFDNGMLLVSNDFLYIAGIPYRKEFPGTKVVLLEPLLKKVRELGLPDFSEPYISPKTHGPAIAVAYPIDETDGTPKGFLVGSINLSKDYFVEDLINYKIGNKGYIYIFNKDRNLILHPDKKRIMKNDIRPGTNKLLDKAIEGFEGSGETINSRGVAQIVSYKRLRMVDWILGAAFPQDEAYAPVKALSYYLLTTTLIFTIISVLLIWLLTARITSNLNSFTNQIRYIKDESAGMRKIEIKGQDEVALLADAFNDLMCELDQARASLDEMSRTDHLTGLFNRRHMSMEAPQLISLSERQKAPTGLLLLDIDHFKKINDTYGHDAGDEVLVHIAQILRQAVRQYDLVVRHGGEEFIVLLPITTHEGAMEVAERIRHNIETAQMAYEDRIFSITVSIGVYVAESIPNIHEAIGCADNALFKAKNSGRNRVCVEHQD